MSKKIGDKKIGGVKSAGEASGIGRTEAVGGVAEVKAATGVGGVGATGGVRRRQSTRTMSMEEREELFRMISEEAEALFGKGVAEGHKEIVQNAVKMAVDAGLLAEEEEEDDGRS